MSRKKKIQSSPPPSSGGSGGMSEGNPVSGKDPSLMPSQEAILSKQVLVSPKGNRYLIVRTNEKDPYDPPQNHEEATDSKGR